MTRQVLICLLVYTGGGDQALGDTCCSVLLVTPALIKRGGSEREVICTVPDAEQILRRW